MSNAKILIVDANAKTLKEVSRVLVHAGYEVTTATTGAEGERLVAACPPHLVLLDFVLPDMPGTEVLRRIKADAKSSGVSVVLLSSLLGTPLQHSADLDADADGYIVRPISNHELLARVRGILRQRELVRSLRASEARFRDLIANQPEAVLVLDQGGDIQFVNAATESLLGRTAAALIGAPFGYSVDSGQIQEIEILRPDGGTALAEVRVASTEWEGRPAWIATLRDVTERRRAEMKLHRLNRLYQVLSRTNEAIVRAANETDLFPAVCRVAVEQAQFVMAAVVTFDMATGQVRPLAHFGADHGYFSEVSIVVCDGEPGQGVIGTSIKSGRHDFCNDIANDPRMIPWAAAAQRRGYRSTASFPIARDGALTGALVLYSREVNYFLPDEVQLLVSVAADISFALDSFHSAASLRVSQRQNELLLRSIGEGIHGIDRAGRITFENPAAIAMLGWDEREMIGRTAHATMHHHRADGSEYPGEQCQIRQTLRDGQTRHVKNEVFFRKDGSSFPVEYVCSPLRDEAGDVAGAVLVFRDVTEQRLAGEKLKLTQARYRDQAILLSNAQRMGHMGSWSLDIGDERMVWSDAACALFGIAPDEFAGTREHFYSFVLPEDRPGLSADYSRVVSSGGQLDVESEFRIRRPDGELRWMMVRGNAHPGADGILGRRFGMYMDITDRKCAEERILRLNRVYALLSALNAELVRIPDQESLFDTACRIAVDTGKMHAACIGLLDAETGAGRVVAHAGNMQDYHVDLHVSGAVGPLGGGPFGVCMREGRSVVCNDIENDPTFAPWRENALKRGFKSVGVFPLKLNGRTFGGYAHYADVPNFFDAEESRLLDELAANISFAVEYLEKEQRRQAAESAMRESEERLRAIYEQAAVGICLVSLECRFENVNRRFCEILGHDADNLLKGASTVDMTHPDDREADARAVAKLLAGATSITLEKRFLKRDQQVVWVRLTLSVLRSSRGDARKFIGVIEDISARQALEEQLRRSQRLESIGARSSA